MVSKSEFWYQENKTIYNHFEETTLLLDQCLTNKNPIMSKDKLYPLKRFKVHEPPIPGKIEWHVAATHLRQH